MPIDSDRRKVLQAVGSATALGLAGCAGGGNGGNETELTQEFDLDFGWTPRRNVSVVVPWGAGGGTDTMVRSVMNPAEDILRQNDIGVSINVQNITGANGLNATSYVQSQPADGHTLFANTVVLERNIVQDQGNISLDDWAGIARTQYDTSWLYSSGRDGVGHDSIDSLVEKANNEGVQFGLVGGALSAVFLLQFAEGAGILDNIQIVTYSDAGRMQSDVISGEIDAAQGEIQEIRPQVEEGELELLFVGTEEPVDEFSEVTASGEKGWEALYAVTRGFVAYDGTPQESLDFWTKLIKNAMQTDSYQSYEEDSLLYLRDGFMPQQEYMDFLQQSIEDLREAKDLYEEVTQTSA
ncbi:tripartite tricarboxylate transporter substrate-binding protein [Natrinema sp. 1APR25-10V2]|uniref:tripartite tricarboxylate transporter substrate-binding protein n=1 Tax=Natrinema sp. 1APR25-10V2 TaxID=2951081 RepID=UPI0028750F32|nr:tripartite tricarboxylate transporter substrate-binding protein [Natrinema sp. 1APR25-10V2]MDS0476937.1 tripartite tricarboxylate transporter substrate-binding protein [Natrinema sp. 1APR25-10V2]